VLVPTTLIGTADVPDVVVACATLVTAALFRPVRSRVQRVVDRRFDRARYDAAAELDRFAGRLRDELDQAMVVDDVRTVLARTVGPTSVGVILVGEPAP
ncbi:MAG: hypothetical protein R3320_13370, partial [Nitriliruptorales bacterium]|nr:hypothetical protein [Nitriliruptorales bacterium]